MASGPSDDDGDIERMERLLRQRWAVDKKVMRPVFEDAEQKRMAEKLLGHANTERLIRRPSDARSFRPKQVEVKFEHYWVPGGEYSAFAYWRINKIEDGQQEEFRRCYTDAELRSELVKLAKDGHKCPRLEMGHRVAAPRAADRPKPASARREMLERYGKMRGR